MFRIRIQRNHTILPILINQYLELGLNLLVAYMSLVEIYEDVTMEIKVNKNLLGNLTAAVFQQGQTYCWRRTAVGQRTIAQIACTLSNYVQKNITCSHQRSSHFSVDKLNVTS